jgi:hypothetical protein
MTSPVNFSAAWLPAPAAVAETPSPSVRSARFHQLVEFRKVDLGQADHAGNLPAPAGRRLPRAGARNGPHQPDRHLTAVAARLQTGSLRTDRRPAGALHHQRVLTGVLRPPPEGPAAGAAGASCWRWPASWGAAGGACRRPTSTTPGPAALPLPRDRTKLVPLVVPMPVVLALHDAQPYHHVTDPAQRLDVPGVGSGLDQLLHVQQAQGPTSGWSLIVYLLAWVIVSSAW